MKYLKLFEGFRKKDLYADGGDMYLYPYLQDNNKIIKTSNDYPEMIEHHANFFKKRPDIYPIVYKQTKNYLILEKLDDVKANKDIIGMLYFYKNKYAIKPRNIFSDRQLTEGEFLEQLMFDFFRYGIYKNIVIDKYKELWDRIKYIATTVIPLYQNGELPDINTSNFGYSKEGILKLLDV
jgi:hypothetical protein